MSYFLLILSQPNEIKAANCIFVFVIGIMNLKALQDVMSTQSLPYVFPFSQFSFPTDLGFVILAESRKSAFFQVRLIYNSFMQYILIVCLHQQTSITLPLQRETEGSREDLYKLPKQINLPPAHKLSQFRRLVIVAKVGKAQVGVAASEVCHGSQNVVSGSITDMRGYSIFRTTLFARDRMTRA